MDIWWRITGYVRVRVYSAVPEHLLGELSRRIQIRDVRHPSPVCMECTVSRLAIEILGQIVASDGGKWEVLGAYGLPVYMKKVGRVPILTCFIAAVLTASLAIPSRVLFIRVQGNQHLPARQILSAAEEAGLSFGVSRRDLRSEQIKNQLLERLPELAWVGVNTSGCVATVSVEERRPDPQMEDSAPGHIVAGCDAVVTDYTATGGKALCRQGQAVRKGDILISGYLDLGVCTGVSRADGEVYGLTRRQISTVLPENTLSVIQKGKPVKKYGLIIGKKRINFHKDGGILYPGCGKMTEIKPLVLPGGWKLPVSLVIEQYTPGDLSFVERDEGTAEQTMRSWAQALVAQQMIAGQIRDSQMQMSREDGRLILRSAYSCREMIGRRGTEVFIEGDTNDDGKND